MSKKNGKSVKVIEPEVIEPKPSGCENCKNTGLEPGVSRDTAQVCPVCNGSPFEPKKETK